MLENGTPDFVKFNMIISRVNTCYSLGIMKQGIRVIWDISSTTKLIGLLENKISM